MTSYLETGLKEMEIHGFKNLFKTKDFRIIPRLDYFFVKGSDATGHQLKGMGSDHHPIMVKIALR